MNILKPTLFWFFEILFEFSKFLPFLLILSLRQTLERAVTHKIPMKKMRTLFKKYLEFEQKYGNDETVSTVKTLAANYVHNEINS